ncbi:MAG: T9SS type A sorting domain-containing protein [Actinobacteria bacterium]|nr:T9SS type A sorting domain-containing protein [Actinomycetota bacterium]
MLKNIVLIILFCSRFTIAQNWELQNSGTKATLRSVSFVDSLHGYVVGDSSTVLKTTNGGKNWLKLSIPISSVTFRKVQFISKTVGFVVSSDGSLLSTTDSGLNWSVDIIMPDSSGFFHDDLCFINENEGWMTGRKEGKNYGIGLIMHTTTGGKTWTKQLELKSYIQTDVKYFTSIKFINRETGWALASDYFDNFSLSFIYKTNDKGLTWQKISSFSVPNNSLNLASKDTIWSCGMALVISYDGGVNWSEKFSFGPGNIRIVSLETGLKGWAFYWNIFGNEKKILRTISAGKLWIEDLNLIEIIYGMSNTSGYLWIVGENGLIMKKKPLSTSILNPSNVIPVDYELFQNYPNPFNPSTTIQFVIPNPIDRMRNLQDFSPEQIRDRNDRTHVTLKIYDVLGREVANLADGVYEAGKYEVTFNANSLPSGVYFYTLRTDNYALTKKMLLLK